MKISVVGPEASGTKLMTRILTDAGAETQHKSFPWGGNGPDDPRHWPETDVWSFRPHHIVWMNRDWWITSVSQVRAGHVENTYEAWNNIQEATDRIAVLISDFPFTMVNYESLVRNPEFVVRNLVSRLNLKMPALERIYDGNEKYVTSVSA